MEYSVRVTDYPVSDGSCRAAQVDWKSGWAAVESTAGFVRLERCSARKESTVTVYADHLPGLIHALINAPYVPERVRDEIHKMLQVWKLEENTPEWSPLVEKVQCVRVTQAVVDGAPSDIAV